MDAHLLEIQKRLIGFDTTSRNSNLEMAGFIAETLRALGFSAELLPGGEDGKANVFATLGPPDQGGLMLAGHMDVVPVDGQDWSTDPFELTQREGRLYGRGTTDMKSFIALCLAAAGELRGARLARPLHLAFTYDEEVGCNGAEELMQALVARGGPLPAWGVIGEPTGFQVHRMHKGYRAVEVLVRGVEGHSSMPDRGANAIACMGRVLEQVARVTEECRGRRSLEEHFEIPYTTLSVGTIQGGSAINIIPNHCALALEYRFLPTEDPDYVFRQLEGHISEVLRPEFKKQHPEADIDIRVTQHKPPMMLEPGSEVERAVLEIAGRNAASAAPYYTEGAIYNQAGIPTVVCGPGDIGQAHRPNESISVEQMEQGLEYVRRLITRFCRGG
ncbi:MAG: acetylornithine deacetylase [Deltaproteobacteria bacterium]|nr:acetylornithine deacetylase [Deltaproteobacteria bacterium]